MRTIILEAGRDPAFFQYFWANSVDGIDPTEHCLASLIGKRHKTVSPDLINFGGRTDMKVGNSDYVYVCGVSASYTHKHNFHMPLMFAPNEIAEVTTHRGTLVRATNARLMPISDVVAKTKYKHLGYKFYTCRNFQFAIDLHDRGLIPAGSKFNPYKNKGKKF